MGWNKSLETKLIDDVAYCPITGCWVWVGGWFNSGYGRIYHNGKYRRAHRVVWEKFKGLIPYDKQLDHLCRNRLCVNPDHLELVTSKENTMRGISFAATNATKTHCLRGHAFTAENTISRGRGGRDCRACKVERDRLRWAQKQRLIVASRLLKGGE